MIHGERFFARAGVYSSRIHSQVARSPSARSTSARQPELARRAPGSIDAPLELAGRRARARRDPRRRRRPRVQRCVQLERRDVSMPVPMLKTPPSWPPPRACPRTTSADVDVVARLARRRRRSSSASPRGSRSRKIATTPPLEARRLPRPVDVARTAARRGCVPYSRFQPREVLLGRRAWRCRTARAAARGESSPAGPSHSP